MTRAFAEEIGLHALNVGKRNNLTKFLYNLRNSHNKETINANYIFANLDLKRLEPDLANKIAMLVSPNDKSHDFIETLLINAGFNVKLFTVEAEAIDWLDEDVNIL